MSDDSYVVVYVVQLSLWLVPESIVFADLQRVIEDLAHQANGVKFLPHVTLLTADSRMYFSSIFDAEITCSEVTLHQDGLAISESFYTGFYLKFSDVSSLFNLCDDLTISKERFSQQYEPHISLFYGHLALQQREALAKQIYAKLPRVVRFDRMQLWNVQGNVKDWHLVVEKSLNEYLPKNDQ